MLRHIQLPLDLAASQIPYWPKPNSSELDEYTHAHFANQWPSWQKKKQDNTFLIRTLEMDFPSHSRNTNFLNSICSNSWPQNEHPGSRTNASRSQESTKLHYDKSKEEKHINQKMSKITLEPIYNHWLLLFLFCKYSFKLLSA